MAKFLQGAKVPHRKGTQSSEASVMPIPESVSILMSQHLGTPCVPNVKRGDQVSVGQQIGDCPDNWCVPIHSSVSGTVKSLTNQTVMPNGDRVDTIVIETDGEQTLWEGITPPKVETREELVEAVRQSGIVGLGGAGFPTHMKLNPPKEVHTLLINGAECEPYITSDNYTMVTRGEDILHGMNTIAQLLDLSFIYIGIEDNKPEAIEKMKEIAGKNPKAKVVELPALYPQGAEKVFIYNVLDGLVVPEGQLPFDVGVIVLNVTTVAEIGRYLKDGIPLTQKCITIDGSAAANPQNIIAPIGASVKDIYGFAGGYKEDPAKILMGGPMMGLALSTDEFPLIKQNNALLAFNAKEATRYEESPCISCGRCMRACPVNLMPSQLKEATEIGSCDLLQEMGMNICMECGCCSFVCPAKQELVQSHRRAKGMLADAKKKAQMEAVAVAEQS